MMGGYIDERLLVRHVLIGCVSETCVDSLNGLCMNPSIPVNGRVCCEACIDERVH